MHGPMHAEDPAELLQAHPLGGVAESQEPEEGVHGGHPGGPERADVAGGDPPVRRGHLLHLGLAQVRAGPGAARARVPRVPLRRRHALHCHGVRHVGLRAGGPDDAARAAAAGQEAWPPGRAG
jgi:hypothetical protein